MRIVLRPGRSRRRAQDAEDSGAEERAEAPAGPSEQHDGARRQALVRAALWVVGGGGLVGLAFALSFYLTIKSERRASEVVVPELSGLPFQTAEEIVGPLGLVAEVADQRHDPAVPSGRILQQEPRSGSRVRRGRKLKLVVSLGGKVLEVPDLLGKADRAVEIQLERDGFGAGDEARVYSWSAPTGRIMAQVPPPGSPGVPGTRVHRLVSDGPRTVAWVMPDLSGLPRRSVEQWIDRGGFRRGPVRTIAARGKAPGTVVGQLPLAGYPIRQNDIVELTLAR